MKTFRKWRRNSTHFTKSGRGVKLMQDVLTSVIRRIINEFHALQLLVLKNKINYGGGMWDLCKIIRYFDFRLRKSDT